MITVERYKPQPWGSGGHASVVPISYRPPDVFAKFYECIFTCASVSVEQSANVQIWGLVAEVS